MSEDDKWTGVFKFRVGEKVRSRVHECEGEGIVEYCQMTRYITGDEIYYRIRFNDPKICKTDTLIIEGEWLEKI